jgi:hypothetical protein
MDDEINTSFDMRSDTPEGKDPDTYSKTLRRYHELLWSKPLPSGQVFVMRPEGRRRYLYHESSLGQFFLGSDTIVHTYGSWLRMRPITDQIPEEEREAFRRIGYTIGGMTVFPGNTIERRQTINGARGTRPAISDRFDLTLETIRRHYAGDESPLSDVLARYDDFFRLFGDFAGYVEFFHFQDLVTPAGSVDVYLPFDDFRRSALPQSVEEYRTYRDRSVAFVNARNARIDAWVAAQR